MRVIRDQIWLCDDCLHVAVNGDTSGIEYSLGSGTAYDVRIAAIESGLTSLGPQLVTDYDSETGNGIAEFSRNGCDCCQSPLHGQLHRFAVLGPDLAIGDRVELCPSTDRWMMGDKYGAVVAIGKGRRAKQVRVKLDRSGRSIWFADDLLTRWTMSD